jgi:hypothetical protein
VLRCGGSAGHLRDHTTSHRGVLKSVDVVYLG